MSGLGGWWQGDLLTKDRPTAPTGGKGGVRCGVEGPTFKGASSWFLVSANSWKGRMLLEATSETNHGGWAPP